MSNQNDYDRIERNAKRRKLIKNTVIYIFLAIWGLMVLFPFY